MIEYLRIRGLGVISEADLELAGGLVAVTGETGAGKTMIMTALDLLFGGKANRALIRSGEAQAEVEAGVRPADPAALERRHGVELDDGLLIVGRSVTGNRSRAWIGGRGAQTSLLSDLGDDLVVRHGQNDQRRLNNARYRRELLDRYAGSQHLAAIAGFATVLGEWRQVRDELDRLRTASRDAAQQADLLRQGAAEIAAAAPRAGEEAELRSQLQRLEHVEQLREAVTRALAALMDDAGAQSAVATAEQLLRRGARLDDSLAGSADALGSALAIIGDTASALASQLDDLDADPQRLDAAQQRLALLKGLARRYGGSVEAALEWAQDADARLADLDQSGDRVQELQRRAQELAEQVRTAAGRLSGTRAEAAGRLQEAATAELRGLALPHASLQVSVTQHPDQAGLRLADGRVVALRQDGFDDVDVLFVAHAEAAPRPIEQAASGGELSRIMLALEAVLAGSQPSPVFVFDEVDAGIGGRAAVEVGRRLAVLAQTAQVIVVTHLPQVAAFADQHIVVRKGSDGRVTSVVGLEPDERRRELARMMAGRDDSASALAHAGELIDLAAAERRSRARVG